MVVQMPKSTWTDEQRAIINSRDENVVVRARAGTGKTTTLVGYTAARAETRFGYLVFNKANRAEAERRFSANVTPLTSHGLAFRAVGHRFKAKLGTPTAIDISRSFDVNYRVAAAALKLLQRWMSSGEERVADLVGPGDAASADALLVATQIWDAMKDVSRNDILMPHDGYLKLYALENHQIPFDTIVLDEGQDTNPITMSILQKQNRPLVVVGDEYQSIYGFRGAVNAMDEFAGTQHHLTQSFRFGPEIAAAANAVLHQFGEQKVLEGRGEGSKVFSDVPGARVYTHLSRTNAGVIEHAIAAAGKSLHFVGGLESYRTARIMDVYRLYSHATAEIRDHEIKKFTRYSDLVGYADDTDGLELQAIIKLVEKHEDKLPQQLADLSRRAECPAEEATVTLTTAHRSKGLEWDNVILGQFFDWNDFTEAKAAGKFNQYREELNLLYVAATRARKNLVVNATLGAAIEEAEFGISPPAQDEAAAPRQWLSSGAPAMG